MMGYGGNGGTGGGVGGGRHHQMGGQYPDLYEQQNPNPSSHGVKRPRGMMSMGHVSSLEDSHWLPSPHLRPPLLGHASVGMGLIGPADMVGFQGMGTGMGVRGGPMGGRHLAHAGSGTVGGLGLAEGSEAGVGGEGGGGVLGPLPAVKLRGLPFQCVDADVAGFLAGLGLVDIVMAYRGGRFSGEAYVVLGSLEEVEMALQRNRQNMGRRYIEVFRCSRADYYRAIATNVLENEGFLSESQGAHHPPRGAYDTEFAESRPMKPIPQRESKEFTGVLWMRGLPFAATTMDVINFFHEFNLSEENVNIVHTASGRATGEGFVVFQTPEDSSAAMALHRSKMGTRYIELFSTTLEEANAWMVSKGSR